MTRYESTKVLETLEGLKRSEIRKCNKDLFRGTSDVTIDSCKSWAKQVIYESYARLANHENDFLHTHSVVLATLPNCSQPCEIAVIVNLAISRI